MSPITFRSSRIVYYGPHACENCGVPIVKMALEFGGTSFTNPEGPIYPNTEWHPHVCDPAMVKRAKSTTVRPIVLTCWPQAHALETANGKGFIILGEPCKPDSEHALVISPCSTYYDTEDAAWEDAVRRQTTGMPTWHINLKRDATSYLSNDLEALPECPH